MYIYLFYLTLFYIYTELLIRVLCECSVEHIFNEKRNSNGISHRVVIDNGDDLFLYLQDII